MAIQRLLQSGGLDRLYAPALLPVLSSHFSSWQGSLQAPTSAIGPLLWGKPGRWSLLAQLSGPTRQKGWFGPHLQVLKLTEGFVLCGPRVSLLSALGRLVAWDSPVCRGGDGAEAGLGCAHLHFCLFRAFPPQRRQILGSLAQASYLWFPIPCGEGICFFEFWVQGPQQGHLHRGVDTSSSAGLRLRESTAERLPSLLQATK